MSKDSQSLLTLILVAVIAGMYFYMDYQKDRGIEWAVLKICRRAAEMHAIYPDSDYIGDKISEAEIFGESPFTLNMEEKHFNGRCVSATRAMNLIE